MQEILKGCALKKTQPILAFYCLSRSNVIVWQFVTASLLRNMNDGGSLLGPFILVSMPGLWCCNKHPPCCPGRCQSNSHGAEPRIRSKKKQCYNKDLAKLGLPCASAELVFWTSAWGLLALRAILGRSGFCEGEKCFYDVFLYCSGVQGLRGEHGLAVPGAVQTPIPQTLQQRFLQKGSAN